MFLRFEAMALYLNEIRSTNVPIIDTNHAFAHFSFAISLWGWGFVSNPQKLIMRCSYIG
jgi:hypothetical protein